MSSKFGLLVSNAGIFTQLQDQGRFYQAQQGLSQGGVCDELAGGWANYLLQNPVNTPVLEISFGQAKFDAICDMQLALTGAPMDASITLLSGEKVKQANNCSFMLKQGQSLSLSFALSGVRAYLAVKGGFLVEPTLGSVSTVKRNGVGGLHGNGLQLQAGDYLPISAQPTKFVNYNMPAKYIPDYTQAVSLSVIESYQHHSFSVAEKNKFYNNNYKIDKCSDRMGMRLQGIPIKGKMTGIVSEGIALGSVQIPADGSPIILLQDRQTLGGYPKIGCVSRCDLSRLAQQNLEKNIRFKRGNLEIERLRYLSRMRFFHCCA